MLSWKHDEKALKHSSEPFGLGRYDTDSRRNPSHYTISNSRTQHGVAAVVDGVTDLVRIVFVSSVSDCQQEYAVHCFKFNRFRFSIGVVISNRLQRNLTMKKFYVFQINLSDEDYEIAEYKNRYLNTMLSPTPEAIRDAETMYEMVAEIDALNFEHVFEIGNIGPEENIKRLKPMHSVSVGDVILDSDGNARYVDNYGFGSVNFKGV